jgi:hypothetical protein
MAAAKSQSIENEGVAKALHSLGKREKKGW